MKRNYASLFSVLFIAVVLVGSWFFMMPQWVNSSKPLGEFSTQRALDHIKIISGKPHYVGSQNHEAVAQYLLKELQALGLPTKVEHGTTLSDWGNLVKSKNILARIEGSDNS